MKNKVCTKCKEEKPITDFYTQNKKSKSGKIVVYPKSECKPCFNERKRNHEEIEDESFRIDCIKALFKIDGFKF